MKFSDEKSFKKSKEGAKISPKSIKTFRDDNDIRNREIAKGRSRKILLMSNTTEPKSSRPTKISQRQAGTERKKKGKERIKLGKSGNR